MYWLLSWCLILSTWTVKCHILKVADLPLGTGCVKHGCSELHVSIVFSWACVECCGTHIICLDEIALSVVSTI